MGSFFGGLLAERGLEVVLVDVWQQHVDTINQTGLRIVGVGGDRQVRVRATSDPAVEQQVDVVSQQYRKHCTDSYRSCAAHLFNFSIHLSIWVVFGRV